MMAGPLRFSGRVAVVTGAGGGNLIFKLYLTNYLLIRYLILVNPSHFNVLD